MDRPPAPDDAAIVGLIDTAQDNAWQPIAETRAWNWQQGTMLQWLPSAPGRLIIHNARQGDRFVSVVRDVFTGGARTLPRPIYAVSPNGNSALSTNFARIADTRPGYGYVGLGGPATLGPSTSLRAVSLSNRRQAGPPPLVARARGPGGRSRQAVLADPGRDDPHPDDDGIHGMDLKTGDSQLIIPYAQVANLRRDESMDGAKHWFNHIQVNTDGSRFAFLHRWSPWGQLRPWKTRLFTANFDGSDLYCVADHGMVSHYDWRDPAHILAWARQKAVGDRFFLLTDRSGEREVVGEGVLTTDGHCSYSPDRRWILTDTYPRAERLRTLILYRVEDGLRIDVGSFFAPPELDGEIRCDLHPRWSRTGQQICFDSAHEGTRQIYVVDVSGVVGRV